MSLHQHILRAWAVLEERELARALYARRVGGDGNAPEQVYYSTQIARERHNRDANRYSNVLPYDRAVVGAGDGQEYINASVVVAAGTWWVAAQAPLPDNFAAFFRSILHRRASSSPLLANLAPPRSNHAILVQLTGWTERGQPKADPYMPKGIDARVFHSPSGSVHLSKRSSATRPNLGAEYYELELADDKDAITLHHYFYGAWPDHGVPEGKAIAQLRALVLEVREVAKKHGAEVWVHCSAGVGRTGTFITLSSMLDAPAAPSPKQHEGPPSPLGPLNLDDPIAQRVDEIREYRCMLVQTAQQLTLLYAMLGA